MATKVASAQRSAAIISTALRTPAQRVLSPAIRAIPTPRTLFTRTRVTPRPYKIPTSYLTKSLQLQNRQNSNNPNSLREWGFEEINASLPSTGNSPTHTPILIDVREPAELSGTGIIPSAISIPLASQPDALWLTPDEFETRFGFAKPPVDGTQVVFYCKAGVRAQAAAQMAVQAGYDPSRVGIYWGSWLDWEKNGGRVERWEGDDE